tara:strand:- start:45387 stop:46028 length:642 start_codon:yes stop_codon:yes gene_type:complete
MARNYNLFDKLCLHFDNAIRTVASTHGQAQRENPANGVVDDEPDEKQRKHAAALMRVNHVGEVCAQALYQGQALTAKLPKVRAAMEHAAEEEVDHLVWCEQRIDELDSHTSYLNPLWYLGSFAMGAVAGAVGDKWSLGFVAETERQVTAHLDSHLDTLPIEDKRSRAIVEQMREDEIKHAEMAVDAGAADLPKPVKKLMGLIAKAMTNTAYYI